MNSLIILLLFLIIILSIYLIYRNYQDYNVLEKFSTQSSLSTYFQNTVDSDDYQTYTNTFNGMNQSSNTNIIAPVGWNGIYLDSNNNINAQFLQVNDKIIVVLSNYNYSSLLSNNLINNVTQCTNLFIGIGNLNANRTIFRITKSICNGFTDPTGILKIGPNGSPINIYFTGQLNNNVNPYTITLFPNPSINSTSSITLSLNQAFTGYTSDNYPFLSPYMKQISPFLQENPTINMESEPFEYSNSICPVGTTACNNTTSGYNTLSYDVNGQQYNGCCNTTDNSLNCFFNITYTGNTPQPSYPICPDTFSLNYYQNYNSSSYLIGSTGNSLNICNTLNYFTNNSGIVAILCYVTNLTNVQTLTYQFFGVGPNESSLTAQYDMMNQQLNGYTGSTGNGSLNNYRNNITSGISLTNCIESSNYNNLNEMQSICTNTVNNYISKNVPPANVNTTLLPTVWQINSGQNYNIVNSCPFILNTSILYNTQTTPIKYVECNDDGTINLSLNGGGNNQNLYMQDTIVLNQGTAQNNYYAIATNIRANNGLYLVPSNDLSGFYNNSTAISLMDNPNPNGKWLILGFPLSTLSDLNNIIKTYTF